MAVTTSTGLTYAGLVTNVSISSNVLTVTIMHGHLLAAASKINFVQLKNATFLNAAALTVASSSCSGSTCTVTANYTHANYTSPSAVTGGTYTSGVTATGLAGETCTLTSFNNGSTGTTATVTLTGSNAIANGTPLTITSPGSGATSSPTSATASSGSASCSGTAVITTQLTHESGFAEMFAPATGTPYWNTTIYPQNPVVRSPGDNMAADVYVVDNSGPQNGDIKSLSLTGSFTNYGLFELTAQPGSNWVTLFGSGNYVAHLMYPMPRLADGVPNICYVGPTVFTSTMSLTATSTTATTTTLNIAIGAQLSGTGLAVPTTVTNVAISGGIATLTLSAAATATNSAAPVTVDQYPPPVAYGNPGNGYTTHSGRTYPIQNFCYQVDSSANFSPGDVIEISSPDCAAESEIVTSVPDSTHIVAAARCERTAAKTLFYKGPAVGLGVSFANDDWQPSLTGPSSGAWQGNLMTYYPIGMADSSGNLYAWDYIVLKGPRSAGSGVRAFSAISTQVLSGTYQSGITATGSVGQTCDLTTFNNGSSARATVALTGTNAIATGTPLTITVQGTGATAAPTSATATNGTATCSGTASITTQMSDTVPVISSIPTMGGVASGTYTSGITAVGSANQTCDLTLFNNGSSATATVALSSSNTIATGTPLTITSQGTGATLRPTTATASAGTASCSGTATIVTDLAATAVTVTSAGDYAIDPMNISQIEAAPHEPNSIIFSGGTCNPPPTAHFVTTYNSGTSMNVVATGTNSVVIDSGGDCTVNPSVAVVDSYAPNGYRLAPMSYIRSVTTPYSEIASTNALSQTVGKQYTLEPNPYVDGTYSGFAAGTQAFGTGDAQYQAPWASQYITIDSQLGGAQFSPNAAERPYRGVSQLGVPPNEFATEKLTTPWQYFALLPQSQQQAAYLSQLPASQLSQQSQFGRFQPGYMNYTTGIFSYLYYQINPPTVGALYITCTNTGEDGGDTHPCKKGATGESPWWLAAYNDGNISGNEYGLKVNIPSGTLDLYNNGHEQGSITSNGMTLNALTISPAGGCIGCIISGIGDPIVTNPQACSATTHAGQIYSQQDANSPNQLWTCSQAPGSGGSSYAWVQQGGSWQALTTPVSPGFEANGTVNFVGQKVPFGGGPAHIDTFTVGGEGNEYFQITRTNSNQSPGTAGDIYVACSDSYGGNACWWVSDGVEVDTQLLLPDTSIFTGSSGGLNAGADLVSTFGLAGASGNVVTQDGVGNVQDGAIASSKLLRNCGTITTTSSTSDSLSCSWVTTSSGCQISALNSTAITLFTGSTYALTTSSGSVSVTHATSPTGGRYSVACSVN